MIDRKIVRPPIQEIVFGAWFPGKPFAPAVVMNVYSQILKVKFPTVVEIPPLPPILQNPPLGHVVLNVGSADFESRKHFKNVEDTMLVQMQSNLFYLNWRRINNASYPSYHVLKETFLDHFAQISEFTDCGEPEALELTYVDHFPVDERVPGFPLHTVFNLFNEGINADHSSVALAMARESISGNFSVSIQTGADIEKKQRLIVSQMTCQGAKKKLKVSEWFDEAHEIISDFFFSTLTQETMKSIGVEGKND